ncbi:MAG: four helix bundle protein [Gemmatimonadaceae bacterium]
MRAYQLSAELIEKAWIDVEQLKAHRVTEKVAGQLYAAIASINANLGEGYSRSSGRDRARIFEYALGSTRESITWYDASSAVLGGEVVAARVAVLEEIRRLLLAAIPRERDRLIRPTRPKPPIE